MDTVLPVTVIVFEPLIPEPSVAVAITVIVPADVGVRSPVVGSIVAEPVPFVTDQVTDLMEAVGGYAIALI